MTLDLTHQKLGWPSRDEVLNPPGSGPRVYARLADQKLGGILRRLEDGSNARVGILAADPIAKATEAPLAIVCEFDRPVSQQTLQETHRLAWSFCRSPLLITLEPHAIRSWTCCEPPRGDLLGPLAPEILNARIDLGRDGSIPRQAAQSLGWLDLVSGDFYRRHEERFQRNQCADQLLLANLKVVREKLKAQNLDYDTTHDLLARLIFIQFLFDRKDSSGKPALGQPKLDRLHEQGILSESYADLEGILRNYDDTYNLFRELNEIFNGDLFPGKGATEQQREAEWQAEMKRVKPRHLDTLAQFVSGNMRMKDGQLSLWREYCFDTIPLEFISSIYEEFVGKTARGTGAHYTPAHIVDFMLDRVLPWDSDQWDLKVLDPACGSGIFLVKAYQRLVHRWKNAHPEEEPKAAILKQLLTRNLFGVDKDPHAVRVASFSLYLAMCDEIDPRYYWTQVKFPRLRHHRLIEADFFSEDRPGFRTEGDADKYDLVIGNAPWGRASATPKAEKWSRKHKWEISNGDIGPLFLTKSARLTDADGRVAMLQPAGTLLFNDLGTAKRFRAKLFNHHGVSDVVNLSSLRFGLFRDAISPSCIVVMSPKHGGEEIVSYCSPKPACATDDDYRIIIEPEDAHLIPWSIAGTDPIVWTALAWGGPRDLQLVRRLGRLATLERLEQEGRVRTRRGRSPGDRGRKQDNLVGMPLLAEDKYMDSALLYLEAKSLPVNTDPSTHSRDSTDMSAFELPQMIVKQSWQKATWRFKATLTRSDRSTGPIFCNRSYFSVHASELSVLEGACLAVNSSVAVYYLLLTSGRFASFIPEPNKKDLLRVPIPEPRAGLLRGIKTLHDLDARACLALGFKDAEAVLVEDLNSVTLKDFKGDRTSPGRQRTSRGENEDLRDYCDYFSRVLRAGFGPDKRVCATVFQETSELLLPVRLVAIHLGWPDADEFRLESIPEGRLRARLQELNEKFLTTPEGREGGIFYQRVARVYDTVKRRGVNVPTVYLIKPDRLRYWTRSMAMRDADEVAADIMSWQKGSDSLPGVRVENRIA